MLHLRRYEDADEPIVWRLHDEEMRQAAAHPDDGPWDDDLRAIRSVLYEKPLTPRSARAEPPARRR